MAGKHTLWKLDGREVRVTSLSKPFWPEEGITKGDLLEYYRDMAPLLLPYMKDRPFIMRAWPDGISGKSFYRWRVPDHAPEWLGRFTYELQSSNRTAEMAVVDELPELIWVVNQGVIEMHPLLSTRQDLEHPTLMFFDLDPVEGVTFPEVLEVATLIGDLLAERGIEGYPKTSGGDGLHIFVPLETRYSFEEVRAWLESFSEALIAKEPGRITIDKRLSERAGKVLVDTSQNAIGKSIVAPYSVRARKGAPVSAPVTWEEVEDGSLRPGDFTLTTIRERVATVDDLYEPVRLRPQKLPE